MATQKLPTLPNGLPAWQMLHLKSTDEKCQFVEVNEALTNDIPSTIKVKIIRYALGIPYVVYEKVSLNDLEIWNEKMNPGRFVEWTTRKGKKRSVVYSRTM